VTALSLFTGEASFYPNAVIVQQAMPMSDDLSTVTAVHEAGHVVVARELGADARSNGRGGPPRPPLDRRRGVEARRSSLSELEAAG
jgi:hypothetical protein